MQVTAFFKKAAAPAPAKGKKTAPVSLGRPGGWALLWWWQGLAAAAIAWDRS